MLDVDTVMPSWYFGKQELRKTPSVADGLDPDTESRYRRDGARFIHEIGNKLGLQSETKATGIIYFHRFYMIHSFRDFPRYVTACCCLFLAGKVEETPKKCRDIIKNARSELTDQQFAQFGDDPREEVMTLERILLQTIRFDLQVDNPYRYVVKYAKSLKGNKEKLQSIVQSTWTFVNDSLCTTLCLQWEPEIIAIALMYLASKLSKFEVQDWVGKTPKHSKWWDMFVEGLSIELLEDICHQVLDLYSSPSSARNISPPPSKTVKPLPKDLNQTPPQKATKMDSPNNGRTPPMTTTPSRQPPEEIKAVITPVVVVPQPPAQVLPPPPPIQPPVPPPNLPANTIPQIHPQPAVQFQYQYPASSTNMPTPPINTGATYQQQPVFGNEPVNNHQQNTTPKLYPPPMPPVAPMALQPPFDRPPFRPYMQQLPPPQVNNSPYQPNYQQYPQHQPVNINPPPYHQPYSNQPLRYNRPPLNQQNMRQPHPNY